MKKKHNNFWVGNYDSKSLLSSKEQATREQVRLSAKVDSMIESLSISSVNKFFDDPVGMQEQLQTHIINKIRK